MKILVLVKEVPDTYGERRLDLETGLAARDASERVLDEIGERAIEWAVSYAEQHAGTEVVLLTLGPATLPQTLRKGLAIGAARAVHVLDDGLVGADLTLTAEALAAAAKQEDFDLILAGNVSTDGSGGVVPALLAERLGLAYLSNLTALVVEGEKVSGDRASDLGTANLSAALPAIASVSEGLPEARFPSIKGVLQAKKKPVAQLGLAELGIDPEALVPRSIVIGAAEKPPRAAGVKITDTGDAGQQLADFLAQNRLV